MSPVRTTGVSAIAIIAMLIAGTAAPVIAGNDFTLTHSSISGLPGDQPVATITFDNTSTTNIRGWSYGICTDAAVVSVAGAASGATTATSNTGGPPEFESINFPTNGVTHGVVICFSGCSELPPGTGYELLTVTYTITGSEGATGSNCFCDSLGVPPIETLFADPVGTAIFPTEICGDVTILDPPEPVTGLTCTPLELSCSCDIVVSWSNPDSYDSINIYRDGVFVTNLAGSATSYNSPDELGNHSFCVEPVRDGMTADQVCCSADCPAVSVPTTGVSGLDCTVDDSVCLATLTWTNTSNYSSLTVSVDGTPVETLSGTATGTSLLLGGPGTYNICIDGTTICGDTISQTCCTAECVDQGGQFLRGDFNGDGARNIADPIAALDFLFNLGPIIDCEDALDGNDDGQVDIGDPVFLLAFLFDAGPQPPEPFDNCGQDPTDTDSLGCNNFPGC